MAMRRESADSKSSSPVSMGGDFGQQFPFLWTYLSEDAWEDGQARQTATLLIFVEEGLVKGCLNDRDQGRTGWRASDSVRGLLEAFEQALSAGSLDWRRNPPKRR